MQQQSIVFTAPCVAELLTEPMREPTEGEVTVQLVRSTISAGTERANLVGDPNVAGRNAPRVSFPRRVGYSSAGVVSRVGEGVTSVKEGDRVFCVWGKHSRYCTLKEKNVYKLDDAVSFEEGALIHIATFPLAAIRKCRLEIGEAAIVMGLGVLGLMCVELLRVAGAAPIIAVDPVESKRARALELGADVALDPFDPSFTERVMALTGNGADVAIEVTGKGQGLDMVLDCMKPFGRVALLGCTRNSDFTIDYYRKVHCPGITLIGAHTMARPKQDSSGGWWTEADDERAVHRLLVTGRLNLRCLIEETHTPEEAPAVYRRLAESPSFPIVQFDWRIQS